MATLGTQFETGKQGMDRFAGRVALVTGAGSGIGEATALRLAAEGASVFCVDLNEETAAACAKAITAAGGVAIGHACDISKAEPVAECVRACVEAFGGLHCVVNMAGLLRFERTHEMDQTAWQQIIDINLTGTFLLCKAVIPHLLETSGNMVNAASTAALAGLPWGSAYSASKGGVLAMTRSMAVEYAKEGLRFNCVCPGDISTNMTANISMPARPPADWMTRIGSLKGPMGPEVVAGVIAMLASDDGAHINGEDIRVDGGTLS